jgi:hypothetical protein
MLPLRNRGNYLTSSNNYIDTETGAVFDEQTIMKVTDTLGNTNYTIRFTFQKSPENVFYNLVVGQNTKGDISSNFILRYASDSLSLKDFKDSGFDLKFFRGDLTIHKYEDFFQNSRPFDRLIRKQGFSNRRSATQSLCRVETDKYGDPIPCETITLDGGGQSGGSGVSFGDSSGGSSNIVIDGFGETSGDASAEVGGGDSNTREAEDPVDSVGGDPCCNMGDSPPDSGLGSINIGDSTSTSAVGGCTFTKEYDLEGRLVGGTFSQGCFAGKGTERTKNESIENIDSCPECPKPSDGVVGVLPPLENTEEVEEDFIPASTEDLSFLENLLNIPPLWKVNPGVLLNRPALTYSHTAIVSDGVLYRLNNGLILYQSNSPRFINGEFKSNLRFSPEASINDRFYYINNPAEGSSTWYEFKLPPPTFASADLDFLFKGFWDASKILGRYVLPVEDIIILIDGKDLDGETASRLQAGIFLVIGIVPGSKVVKPISKLAKGEKAWEIIVKIAGKDALKSSDEIFALLKTEINTAFFWSGNTFGVGGETFAKDFAQKNGGQTLEAILDSGKLELPKLSRTDPVTKEIWDQVSESYAKQASGTVKAIVGASSTSESVWKSIELPALMNNNNVTRIIEIDPFTLKETILK